MLLVGDDSPHLDDVTAMNATLNPSITSLVKVSDCGGLILEEQPEKVKEGKYKWNVMEIAGFFFQKPLSVHFTSRGSRLHPQLH